MVESLREAAIHMMHTRDGARVGMYCFWYGTAKVSFTANVSDMGSCCLLNFLQSDVIILVGVV